MVIPVYISEGAPSYLRGTLISIYQFMIAMGFVIANLLSVAFAQWDPENIGWRLMFGAAAVPALIQVRYDTVSVYLVFQLQKNFTVDLFCLFAGDTTSFGQNGKKRRGSNGVR